MKIAVTAATGQLGNAIVNELKKQIGAANVVAVVRTPSKAGHLGVEVRKGDYNSREEFNEALKGIGAALLVSGRDEPDKRIMQHRNVIEAAKQNGVKKIVYTSIMGKEKDNAFSPIVQSNRSTEEDVRNSGLNWSIGRNGIYIEPDLEYLDQYVAEGGIINCAGEGKCGYTNREELAEAYTQMLINENHNSKTYNLMGPTITQTELAAYLNVGFGTKLRFQNVSVAEYTAQRKAALGDFLGTVIAGIYTGIKEGAYEVPSDFETVVGRPHLTVDQMIEWYKINA
jgi:NAD(P)H dehydrogenase (quinone)